jgi:acyl-coenzyme A synthetase/AMP-(fatty) acid ligase
MRLLHERTPQARLLNLYGPTEATIYCAYHWIDPLELDDTTPVPIGRPVAGMDLAVLDERDRPCPPRTIGELALRGALVSPGYFGDAESTARAFRPARDWTHSDERVYFTGDLGCTDEHGRFYVIGRKDDVVKTRGHRVDLLEVDLVLAAHESVAEAICVAIPEALAGHILVAAVVARSSGEASSGQALDHRTLLTHCGAHLPAYMCPEHFVFLDALPKLPNGKIDRRATAQAVTPAKYT